uniref:Collagen, type XIV, alpha 1 n=1 Tax=Nothobranchius kuhntae TaxID=321403 RepID=A0A1A8IWP1_NOTKU
MAWRSLLILVFLFLLLLPSWSFMLTQTKPLQNTVSMVMGIVHLCLGLPLTSPPPVWLGVGVPRCPVDCLGKQKVRISLTSALSPQSNYRPASSKTTERWRRMTLTATTSPTTQPRNLSPQTTLHSHLMTSNYGLPGCTAARGA